MSGGFFRGTSADQDTRFSNKQAKLMKSQKFAPELEHLVDMTKVKMDVMRPWIANRVTELIGFEDEVLINFIYGLLDGKEVNGKEVQISLTGFMERNTGKFMKELWSLLLSAQKNASGVPQQFLDAKEEETKKKKAESDRIATEIQRRKEKESQELEQERSKKMDRGNDVLKDSDTGRQPSSGYQPRARSVEEKDYEERNSSRQQSRVTMSPRSADRSSSPRGRRARSISKSFSNSRSHSDERHRSRSLSASRKRRERSSSSEMIHRFSPGRSLTPHRRPLTRRSPIHRSSYSSRRSSSRSRRRSPPPTRYRMRSPVRRRSRSPLRRRSRSPFWRRPRSPTRRSSPQDKSWSPLRHRSSSVRRRSRSPVRRNSPSPARYRSPSPMKRKYRRSPLAPRRRSRSPILQRSPSPIRRRSPSAIQRRSSSPIRRRSPIRQMSPSPIRRRSPIAGRRRSPTPSDHKSPSRRVWSSASPDHLSPSPSRKKSPKRQRKSPLQSPGERIRNHEKFSPVRHASPTDACQRPNSLEHQSQSDYWDQNDSHRKVNRLSSSPCKSPVSKAGREMILTEKRREKIPRSDCPSPPKRARGNKPHDDSSEISTDEKEANYLRGNKSEKMDHLEKPVQKDSQMSRDTLLREKRRESPAREKNRAADKNQSHPNDIKINDQKLEAVPKLSRKVEQNERNASVGSGSEESDKNRSKIKDKRKNTRAERSDDESSFDSYAEERKEAKRRRKEEKRARKEKRRRRREEKHRRKEERHSEKKKLKATDTVSTPSDTDRSDVKRLDDDQHVRRRESHRSDMEETVSERKKLEIELREKAIQTLRAKKGISH